MAGNVLEEAKEFARKEEEEGKKADLTWYF